MLSVVHLLKTSLNVVSGAHSLSRIIVKVLTYLDTNVITRD